MTADGQLFTRPVSADVLVPMVGHALYEMAKGRRLVAVDAVELLRLISELQRLRAENDRELWDTITALAEEPQP